MKRLFLSESDKKLGGVCGGIAEYMELDPTIVRLLTVVLALFTAVIPVLIGYILAWMIVPRKPASGA
jgi:phage shock protein C